MKRKRGIRFRIGEVGSPTSAWSMGLTAASPNKNPLRGRPVVEQEIRQLHQVARRAGIEVVLVYFPHKHLLQNRKVGANEEWLSKLAEREDYLFVSLAPHFSDLGNLSYFFIDPIHLSPKGASVAARFLADELKRLDFIGRVM